MFQWKKNSSVCLGEGQALDHSSLIIYSYSMAEHALRAQVSDLNIFKLNSPQMEGNTEDLSQRPGKPLPLGARNVDLEGSGLRLSVFANSTNTRLKKPA